MKGAVTVSTTSPRRNFSRRAHDVRTVNETSAMARLKSATLPGIRFLISTTVGLPEVTGSSDLDPGVPESTRTGACVARCPAIADMIAAVVLRSGRKCWLTTIIFPGFRIDVFSQDYITT